MAEKLALKKFLQLHEKDLTNEKSAILLYLNQMNSHTETVEKFLSEKSEYQSLLDSQFIPRSEELNNWMNASYEKNPFYPENLIHKCISGNIVRSKSEVMIDMILHLNHIAYRYECGLNIGNKTIYPDFTIRHPKTGETYYWEHFGMIDQKKYMEDMLLKLRLYMQNGIIPSVNLIMTFETEEQPFSSEIAELLIEYYFK